MYPIRILHVFGRMDRGGAETMVMNLYRNIDRNLIQFDFAVHTTDICDYEKEISRLGGKIYRFPQFNGINIINYINSWKKFFFKHQEYKIIHGHMYSIASIYLLIAKRYGLYTIAHSHNTSNGSGIKSIAKDIFCLPLKYICDYKMACGIEAAKWLFGYDIAKGQNFKILNNAIDIKKYTSVPEAPRNFNFGNKIVLGHIGRFVEEKNHEFLIKVFSEYLKINQDAVLLLIGRGETEIKTKKLVERLGLKNQVLFLGVCENINEILSLIDAFVFPSIYEGLPVVLVEAQAAGVQCFISDNISDEVCITGCVNKLSLDLPANKWAESIFSKDLRHQDTSKEIKDSGYDIVDTAAWVSKFYLEKYRMNS